MYRENVNNKITNFISYFRDQFQSILKIESNKNTRLFKKLLLNSLLDTLSKATSYSNKKNRESFVDFISKFSGWEYSENVSLPHLIRFLERFPDPEFSELRKYVYSIYDTWPEGIVITLDKDPSYEEIKRLWPSKFQASVDNIKIEFLQHKYLFYRYRNSLVHELREPGYGIEHEDDNYPLYHSMTDIDTNSKTWELIYPLGFYIKICTNCIDNLENYLIRERINPYSQYIFGSYWIEKLNLW